MIDCVDTIKSSVSMRDVCDRYGFTINRQNKTTCPFHDDHNASLHIYPGERGYYCFSCGAHGDVVNFVRQYFGLTFRDALARLDVDFSLGLDLDEESDTDAKKSARIEAERRRAAKQARQAEGRRLKKAYHDALDLWVRTDKTYREQAPQSIEEFGYSSTDWETAVLMMDRVTADLQRAEIALAEFEMRDKKPSIEKNNR